MAFTNIGKMVVRGGIITIGNIPSIGLVEIEYTDDSDPECNSLYIYSKEEAKSLGEWLIKASE